MTIMTAAELGEHKLSGHPRNYLLSGDGYDDMEQAGKSGWKVIPGWGRDGWDLGSWPYVAIYTREVNGSFEMQQIVEGDHTAYSFATSGEREAAINYLFLWYAAHEDWAPAEWEDREKLDAGELEVDPKYLGPFSWGRLDREKDSS